MPEGARSLGPHDVQQRLLAFGSRHGRESPGQRGSPGLSLGGTATRHPAQQFGEESGQGRRTGAQRREIEVRGDEGRLRCCEREVEQAQRLLRRHGHRAGPAPTGEVGLAQPPAHALRARPQAPGQRDRRQPERLALLREAVKEGVRGGVVALARAADGGGTGGEEYERGEAGVPGEFVQEPRPVSLGPQGAVQLFSRQGLDGAVVDDPGGVDHGGQRVLLGYPRQLLGQRGPVGEVTGAQRGLGTQGREFAQQLVRPRRGGAPP